VPAVTIDFGPEDVFDQAAQSPNEGASGVISTLAQVATEPMMPCLWMPAHRVYGPNNGGTAPRKWTGTSVRLNRGAWVQFELDIKANTPNNADGHVKMWLDGSLCLNETGIRFHYTDNAGNVWSTYQTKLERLFFDFSKGGGTSAFATPPAGQSYYFGRIEWWGTV
jgi:hypothetical protein